MQAKVYLNQPLTQERYGLHFEQGEALCDNDYIIKKLQKKGVRVEIIKEEKTLDEMTVTELKEYAAEKNITIASNVRSKADIVEFIKNYKEDNGENPDNTDNNPDTKTDGSDTNVGGTENEE
jgi:hypothetical protein